MKKSRVLSVAHAVIAINLLAACGSDGGTDDPALSESSMESLAANATGSPEAEGGEVLDIEEAARRNRWRWNRGWQPSPAPAPSPSPSPSRPSPEPAPAPSPSPSPAPSPQPAPQPAPAPEPSPAPNPSPAPAPVSTANRQFASGFEAGVSLPQSSEYGNSNQYVQGGDVPGYSFPIRLWSTPQQWSSWILSVVGPSTPMKASEYASGQIQTVTGRNGNQTRALALVSKAKSPSTSVQQITMQNYGLGTEPVLYQRMWVKFDQNTLDRARSVGAGAFYQIFWEVKAEPDYRLRLQLRYGSDGKLYWHTQGDVLTNAVPVWEASLKSVPVVMASPSSSAGWHKVEIYMNRPGGKFKVAIDGQTLIDRSGNLMGKSGARVDQLKFMMVYSDVSPVATTWFDDFEIWSTVPSDAWQK